MHYNAANLAPVQEARKKVGEWLQEHGDKSRWVIGGDIGAIGYYAKDFKFIDTMGLCSNDVLEAYKHGENLNKILIIKNPLYIADTVPIENGEAKYTHLDGTMAKHGEPSTYLYDKKLILEQGYSWANKPYVIVIARIEER